MVQIDIENLSIALNGELIVKDASFQILPGEFVALLGPNGAGKTTLMKAIAGLADYSGRLMIEGREAKNVSIQSRGQLLSYIPQGHDVHWPMCVKDIVRLGRLPYRGAIALDGPEDERSVSEALRLTDLVSFADRRFDQLSGGEKSRVMVARALATGADVLLADEPTAALDPYHQLYMLELLKEQVEAGKSVLAVLHDITLATQFADKIILLNQGQVVGAGKAGDVLTKENMRDVYRVEAAQDFTLEDGMWRRITS